MGKERKNNECGNFYGVDIIDCGRVVRCFFRSLEALNAELALFVNAYNKFGENKERRRVPVIRKKPLENRRLHKFREVPFGIMNFV
jgi:hypothetical protein